MRHRVGGVLRIALIVFVATGIAYVALRPSEVAPILPGVAAPSLKLDYQLRTGGVDRE